MQGHISTIAKGSREAASEGPIVLCIRFSSLSNKVATRGTSPDVTTIFHRWAYGRFIEIQSNLRRKKLVKAPIFFEAVLAVEIM